jgi:hypothetical protein
MNASSADIDREVMSMLLAGDLPILGALRAQYSEARVAKRRRSQIGASITFAVADGVARVSPASFTLTDVHFALRGDPAGGEALLYVQDGVLAELELYNLAEPWPAHPQCAFLAYHVRADPIAPEYATRLTLSSSRDLRYTRWLIEGAAAQRSA